MQPDVYPILLSVVVVLDHAGDSARGLLAPIIDRVAPLVDDFEIVVVDNGSTDNSAAEYAKLVEPDGLPNIQVYRLIRPVDFENAAWAGIENSLGDFVLIFDVYNEDLSFLERALEAAARGAEYVAIQNVAPHRGGFVERISASAFRALFRALAGVDLKAEASQCRMISKQIVAYLLQQPKPALRYRALPAVAGFPRALISYAGSGVGGRRQTTVSRVRRGMNLLFSQTLLPLRLASGLALAGAFVNIVYSIYVVVVRFIMKDVAAGWATLSLQQAGEFLLISIVLFILVEYVAQMFAWNLEGPPYYLAGEHTSAVLRRRQKLNIQHDAAAKRPAVRAK